MALFFDDDDIHCKISKRYAPVASSYVRIFLGSMYECGKRD